MGGDTVVVVVGVLAGAWGEGYAAGGREAGDAGGGDGEERELCGADVVWGGVFK